MSTTYEATGATYDATIPVVTDDDDQRAISYNPTGQRIGDNIEWLRKFTMNDLARYVPAYMAHKREVEVKSGYCASGWADSSAGNMPQWTQTNSTQYPLMFPISSLLPYRSAISWFALELCGASGHGGTLPGTAPTAELIRFPRDAANPGSATAEILDVATLPSGLTVAGYEVPFEIEHTLATKHAYDARYLYFIRMLGESGTNYQAGLRVQAVRFEVVAP